MRRKKILVGIAAGGMIAGLAAVQGTAALWQDSGSASDTVAMTGTVGLTLNGVDDYQWTTMAAGNMKPGDSVGPQSFVVENDGNIPVQYRVTDFAPPTGLPLTYSATRIGGGDIAAWRTLAPGASETWSVTITLPTTAPNSAQGKGGTPAVLTITARQAKHVL